MAIIMMEHPKHGRYPCTESDVDMFLKSGWTVAKKKEVQKEVEPLPAKKEVTIKEEVKPMHAPAVSTKTEVHSLKPKAPAVEPKELTREELIQLAEDVGIAIDGRWGIERIKEELGLN
jgi:hypothetical protein